MMRVRRPPSSSSSCGLTAAVCGKNRYPRPLTTGTDAGTAPLWRAAHISMRSPERSCAFPLASPAPEGPGNNHGIRNPAKSHLTPRLGHSH